MKTAKNQKSEPILKKNLARKKEKTPGGIRNFYHYAFPVLVAIFLFYFFTQYLFNQVKQNNKIERSLIDHQKKLNEIKIKNDLIDDLLKNSLDDAIILNAFKSKYTEEELPYKTEILKVEDLIDRHEFKLAIEQLKPLMKLMPLSPRCLFASAYLIDQISEREKNNIKLYQCIEIYKKLFNSGELHKSLLYVAGRRLVNRLQFIGRLRDAISYGEYMNKMISSNLNIINDLAISYLMANKLKQAKEKFEQVLTLDNNNTIAICHYAVILKTFDNRLEESVIYFKTCLNTREKVALDARFFYHLGDSLQRLNRTDEAYHYYSIGVEYGFFNSVHQRSLFNEPFLRAKPIWNLNETGYQDYFKLLQENWINIKNEAVALLNQNTKAFISLEENLLNKGYSQQLNLYLKGKKIVDNCQKMPITCKIIDQIKPAISCTRGQIKLSYLSGNTKTYSNCGPSNSRIRSHLGLIVPNEDCKLRVFNETLEWQEGKIIVFDDSFEHEIWNNDSNDLLILIIDFWHPDLDISKWTELEPI